MLDHVFSSNPYMISDIHFLHKNIVKYCNRPENWEEELVKYWNKTITPKDIVFIAGDMFVASKTKIQDFLNLNPLNGLKYLLLGNHDEHSINFYLSLDIIPIKSNINYHGRMINAVTYEDVIISHCPLVPVPSGYYNIHGHTHNSPFRQKEDKHINISIEVLDYKFARFNDLRG